MRHLTQAVTQQHLEPPLDIIGKTFPFLGHERRRWRSGKHTGTSVAMPGDYHVTVTVTRIENTASTFPHGPGGPSLPLARRSYLLRYTIKDTIAQMVIALSQFRILPFLILCFGDGT
jgi:hypothetical protein